MIGITDSDNTWYASHEFSWLKGRVKVKKNYVMSPEFSHMNFPDALPMEIFRLQRFLRQKALRQAQGENLAWFSTMAFFIPAFSNDNPNVTTCDSQIDDSWSFGSLMIPFFSTIHLVVAADVEENDFFVRKHECQSNAVAVRKADGMTTFQSSA